MNEKPLRTIQGMVSVDSGHRVFVNDVWIQSERIIGDFRGKFVKIHISEIEG